MTTSRHNILADDSALLTVVLPKSLKNRLVALGVMSKRVRKYITDGVEKDEKRLANGKEK